MSAKIEDYEVKSVVRLTRQDFVSKLDQLFDHSQNLGDVSGEAGVADNEGERIL